jgi:hypothetical protein
MDTLHGYMTEPPVTLPQVIYMHCEAGTDRTGEVSGAYYLKWLNMTFPEALHVDNTIQNRNMSKYSLYGLEYVPPPPPPPRTHGPDLSTVK